MANGKSYVYIGIAHEPGYQEQGAIYRSALGDDGWEELSKGLPPTPQVRTIALHPHQPEKVYAGTQDGVYLSTDRGDHWEKLDSLERPVWSLLFQPRNPQVMYAGYDESQIYRTENGGESWHSLHVNVDYPVVTLQPRFSSKRIIGMAADPNRPDEVYAAVEIGGLIRSLDGGESWQGTTDGLYLNEDAHDFHAVAISPSQPRTVFVVCRIGVFKSSDQGDHWQPLAIEKLTPEGYFRPGSYCRCIDIAPGDPRTVFVGAGAAFRSDEGVLFRSKDLGASWDRVDLGARPKATMFGVCRDRNSPNYAVCAARNGEVFSSLDGGNTWKAIPIPDADIVIGESPTTGGHVYKAEVSALAVG